MEQVPFTAESTTCACSASLSFSLILQDICTAPLAPLLFVASCLHLSSSFFFRHLSYTHSLPDLPF